MVAMRSRTALQVALLLGAIAFASAGLIAVDLGSEYIKVSLIKPGRTPISVVVNEVSKRKSPALVSFVNDERLTGEEAMSMAVRFPETTIPMARDLLGKSPEDPTIAQMMENHALAYKVVEHPLRKVAGVQIKEGQIASPEELVASILQYVKRISEEHAGVPTPDLVLTVPAWFGQTQRKAYLAAAELAGFNVLGMINAHTAAALQYGIERDFSNRTENIILYDMGSGSTEVALIRYSSYTIKEAGKPKQLSQLEVKEVDWDFQLGSNNLDVLMSRYFAEEFATKNNIPLDELMANTKAMAKLKKQVRRTKEILSANTAAPMNVEEFYNNIDFSSSITREAFETLAAPFFARASAPLERVLQRSGLTPEEITGVELLGGGTRVPRILTVLSEALGGRGLDRHLDSDEAVCMGAGLFAANLSTSFRLRKFGMTDVTMFGVEMETIELHQADPMPLEDGTVPEPPPKVRALLPYMKKLPIKRVVHFSNITEGPIKFNLAYNTSEHCHHGLPPGVASPELAEFEITGIEKAIERYNNSGVINLRFTADVGGILRLEKAEASIEYIVMEEKIVEVKNNGTNSSKVTIEDGGNAKAEGEEAGKAEAEAEKEGDEGEKEEGEKEEGEKEESADEADEGGEEAQEDAAEEDGDKDDDEEEEEGKAVDKEEAKEEEKDDKAEVTKEEDRDGSDDSTDSAVTRGKNSTVTRIQVPKKKTAKVSLTIGGAGWLFPYLSGDSLKAAKETLASWVMAENLKRETFASKNELEAYIIKMQSYVSSDETLEKVTTEEEREAFSTSLTENEDWLYEDGEHESAPEFKKRLAELKKIGENMYSRAVEYEERPKIVKAAKEAVELNLKVVNMWSETKPWITEAETKDVTAKLEEFLEWLTGKEAEQAEKKDTEEAAFTTDDIKKQFTKADKLYQKINNKRKPKPPPEPKKDKEEEKKEGDKEGEHKDGDKESSNEEDKKGGDEEDTKDKEEDKNDKKEGKDSKEEDKKEKDAKAKEAGEEEKAKKEKEEKSKKEKEEKARKEKDAKAKKEKDAKAKKEKEEKAKKEKEEKTKKEKEAKAKKEKEAKAKKEKEAKAKKEKEEKAKKEKRKSEL